MSSSQPDDSPDSIEFERSLSELEQNLAQLKVRYAQVEADRQRQQALQNRADSLQQELRRNRSAPGLKTELKQIQQQLEEIELALESQLFSWSGLREIFWQAVRFGGIGVIIGWLLKSCAGS